MKTNINRPILKSEDITAHSNFKDVLLKAKGVQKPFYKSTKWMTGMGIAASVVIVTVVYFSIAYRKEVKPKQAEHKAAPAKVFIAEKPAELAAVPFSPVKEHDRLNGFLKKHSDKSQVFKVPSSGKTKINGNKGTIIDLNPADLETVHARPLGKEIVVELKELTTQSDLLKENAQTVSGGRLLVSGGAYYINMTSNGDQLRIKKGRTMKVEFPKITNDSMSLFYGYRDSLGRVNWKETNEAFAAKTIVETDTSKRQYHQYYAGTKNSFWGYISSSGKIIVQADYDSMMAAQSQPKLTAEQVKYQEVYKATEIASLGWINCDRFLDQPKTDLLVKFSPADSVKYAQSYLVFKKINSVMGSVYYSQSTSNTYRESFEDVPLGYKAKLITFTVKNDEVYAYASDLTIKKGQTIVPRLELINKSELSKLLNSN